MPYYTRSKKVTELPDVPLEKKHWFLRIYVNAPTELRYHFYHCFWEDEGDAVKHFLDIRDNPNKTEWVELKNRYTLLNRKHIIAVELVYETIQLIEKYENCDGTIYMVQQYEKGQETSRKCDGCTEHELHSLL